MNVIKQENLKITLNTVICLLFLTKKKKLSVLFVEASEPFIKIEKATTCTFCRIGRIHNSIKITNQQTTVKDLYKSL